MKRGRKGFTLAELLIVVAIIGVLVAISIPIFSSQLEKAREATDLANIRSAYSEGCAEALTNSNKNCYVVINIHQKEQGWQTKNVSLPGNLYGPTRDSKTIYTPESEFDEQNKGRHITFYDHQPKHTAAVGCIQPGNWPNDLNTPKIFVTWNVKNECKNQGYTLLDTLG
ncbi:MAG: prepilin-type N-terminal cleavage/methylation domain-containing protein [Oribacterium sp.]|nr:prepilin-type N-terminal cleavage/methylation domain-containing protein [Oribacterium sp.]